MPCLNPLLPFPDRLSATAKLWMFELLLSLSLTLAAASAERKYLLYEVGAGEGFNLRRDVHIRMASLLLQLQKSDPTYQWVLVLPLWYHVVHWPYSENGYPWSDFFDVEAMRAVMPVIELSEFIQERSGALTEEARQIDEVFWLSPLRQWAGEGEYPTLVEGSVPVQCESEALRQYPRQPDKPWHAGVFWGKQLRAARLTCLQHMGSPYRLIPHILGGSGRAVMVEQAKQTNHHCHDQHYSSEWWTIRASMQYAPALRQATQLFKQEMGLQGAYVAAHLRRGDFLRHHAAQAPALPVALSALRQARQQLQQELHVEQVGLFVAVASTPDELNQLRKEKPNIVLLQDWSDARNFSAGQQLVLDMLLAAQASYFLGTEGSTVTFRIREDRELLGRLASSTYHVVCANPPCEQGTVRSRAQARDCQYPSFAFEYTPPATAAVTVTAHRAPVRQEL